MVVASTVHNAECHAIQSVAFGSRKSLLGQFGLLFSAASLALPGPSEMFACSKFAVNSNGPRRLLDQRS